MRTIKPPNIRQDPKEMTPRTVKIISMIQRSRLVFVNDWLTVPNQWTTRDMTLDYPLYGEQRMNRAGYSSKWFRDVGKCSEISINGRRHSHSLKHEEFAVYNLMVLPCMYIFMIHLQRNMHTRMHSYSCRLKICNLSVMWLRVTARCIPLSPRNFKILNGLMKSPSL